MRRGAIVLVFIFALGAIAGGVDAWQKSPRYVQLELGGKRYHVRVVSSAADRQKGLSGTKYLPSDRGMLFDFSEEKRWGIWMKDMNYAIDIIWIDASKRVVDMVENADPSSYPSITFKPKKPARYVLELAAGSISNSTITVDSQARFELMKDGGLGA